MAPWQSNNLIIHVCTVCSVDTHTAYYKALMVVITTFDYIQLSYTLKANVVAQIFSIFEVGGFETCL